MELWCCEELIAYRASTVHYPAFTVHDQLSVTATVLCCARIPSIQSQHHVRVWSVGGYYVNNSPPHIHIQTTGFIFILLAVTGIRGKLISYVPKSIMLSTSAGIGAVICA